MLSTTLSNTIHPTAVIEKGAQIGEGVTIGAYAYIGPQAIIGNGNNIHHHASIDGRTEIGEDNEIFPYAYIGAKTHDLKYCGGSPGLKIGNKNVFREYVTVHCATYDDEYTILGDNNVLLAYSHVAHDCIVGNHMVMSSHAALGGHVIVADNVNVGWGVGVHQFCAIGDYAMLGASSKVVQDVMPYMIADGTPACVRIFNKVGLERSGFTPEDMAVIRMIYKTFYRKGLNRAQAIETLKNDSSNSHPLVQRVLKFIENSKRGLA